MYKAIYKPKVKTVALKKFKKEVIKTSDGISHSFIREISILFSLNNKHIVSLMGVVLDNHQNIYMVMEFVENDLSTLISKGLHVKQMDFVKTITYQLLDACDHLHSRHIVHRDIKPSNILVDENNQIKICDFGLARIFTSFPNVEYSSNIVTLFYRAPELLLGINFYKSEIDIWSIGCIMGECIRGAALFRGCNDTEVFEQIFDKLGTPKPQSWPELDHFLAEKKIKLKIDSHAEQFREEMVAAGADKNFLDLFYKLLTFNPSARITAREAMSHPWFTE